jgi:hypothetical protein
MSGGQIVLGSIIGIAAGLIIQAIRIVFVVWNTRVNTLGDYLVAFIWWAIDRRERKRNGNA